RYECGRAQFRRCRWDRLALLRRDRGRRLHARRKARADEPEARHRGSEERCKGAPLMTIAPAIAESRPLTFDYQRLVNAVFAALIPYWSERDPVLCQFQSLYLYVTAVFFSIFFSERTLERAELCLKAYAVGAVVCSVFGLISYFDIAGMYDKFVTVEGRVNGTFKDPNVYGSYMVLAAAYLMHGTILGNKRTLLVTIPSLAAVCIGV